MQTLTKLPIPISIEGQKWAQKMLDGMSLDEKIGQLIHVAAWSNRDEDHENEILDLITKHHLGGLIFFQGNPKHQTELVNHYQSKSQIPLMISIDGEWGLGMRLEGCEPFPYQMTLGAVRDDSLIEEMGKLIARQMKLVGVTLNHAPVVDVNTNPDNPVINFRSFGQNKESVAKKAAAYMRGMQKEHVLACAKHFPGHGDTSVDSHKELPLLDKSKAELMATELSPFKVLFKEGIGAVMVAHLQIPQLEPDPMRASTLSKRIVTDLLKSEMNFNGLVITDALDMHAVADHYDEGEVDVKALLAGNDILLFVKSVPLAIAAIKNAILAGSISEEEIASRCLKQLIYKYWMGLYDFRPLSIDSIDAKVNQDTSKLNDRLYASSLTLVHGDTVLPLPSIKQPTHLISLIANGDQSEKGALSHHTLLNGTNLGNSKSSRFAQLLTDHLEGGLRYHHIGHAQIDEMKSSLFEEIKPNETVVLAIHNLKLKAPDNFGITQGIIDFLGELFQIRKVYLVFFGNPYALAKIPKLEKAKSILLTYQENQYTHKYAAETLLGKHKPIGKLPVAINKKWPEGFSQ